MNKRARNSNFSNDEKITLLNIIAKYKNIVENKKTDNVTVQEKNRAWEKIQTEFNAISPGNCYRDTAGLKKFYENKKKEVRKAAGYERSEIMGTGGGPPPKIKKDPTHEMVLTLINNKTVYGLSNCFDSDNLKYSTLENSHSEDFIFELDKENEIEITESMNVASNCGFTRSLEEPIGVTQNKEFTTSREEPIAKPQDNSVTNAEFSGALDKKWQKYTPTQLQSLPSAALRNDNRTTENVLNQKRNRKRPTIVRALTSSNVAEKYNELLERRLHIANLMEKEFQQKTFEHIKRMELLDLEIAIKKRHLTD